MLIYRLFAAKRKCYGEHHEAGSIPSYGKSNEKKLKKSFKKVLTKEKPSGNINRLA